MKTQKFSTFVYLLPRYLFPILFKCYIYSKWKDLSKTFLYHISIFFYSLWEITNKDNILRGTVPWTFLEGCRHLTSTAFGLKWLYTYLCSLLYYECLEKTDQILFQHLLSLWRQYEQYCAWKCICKFLLNLKMHTMFYINFIVVEIYTI